MLFSCDLVWDSVLTVFPLDKIHMKAKLKWPSFSKTISCENNKYDMLFSCDLVWDSVLTVFPLDKIHMKATLKWPSFQLFRK